MNANTIYQTFLAERLGSAQPRSIASIYHAVRNIPYGSTGQRQPLQVIESNLGSCSGKHILLRDLLRMHGEVAEIVTIFTHFNRGMPAHPAMPQELQDLISNAEVEDYHQFVRVREAGHWRRLDATWHDALIPYGFPVNANWAGGADTVLAGQPLHEYAPAEDIVGLKADLLSGLDPQRLQVRARFLALLTAWIQSLR